MKMFSYIRLLIFTLVSFSFAQTMDVHTASGTSNFNLESIDSITFDIGSVGIPTDGLVAYYPFNGDATDESGNNNNGTVQGATLTADRFGNSNSAYIFDGVDDYINIGNPVEGDSIISISVWVKRNDSLGGLKVVKKPTGSWDNGYWALSAHESAFGFLCPNDAYDSNDGHLFPDTVITYQDWHHVVVTQNDTAIFLYLDNYLMGTRKYVPTLQANNDIWIGGREDIVHNFTAGITDDLRFYNRNLTESEISALYNEGN